MIANSGPAPGGRLRHAIERGIDVTLWALQVVTGLLFLVFGANKFDPGSAFWTSIFGKAGATFWIEVFAKIGVGQWFRYFTGALEMVCGILLFIPRTAGVAAALLACTMVGAILTHVLVLRDGNALVAECTVLLVINCVVAWWRRPNFLRRGLANNAAAEH
jgi:putative oxidoreductase